jgi:glycosyltransferase involved in cell wall biosynthesis
MSIINKKILFLQKDVSDYNIPLYEYLDSFYDVTVAYTGCCNNKDCLNFEVHKLKSNNFYNLIFINKLLKFCSNFDVVFFMADLHFISFCFLPLLKTSFKSISWSIGFRSSYTRKYDVNRKKELLDYLYLFILKYSDANVFYSEGPISFWGNLLNKNKIFIANNTIKVEVDEQYVYDNSRKRILFIGTLYKEKGIDELLRVMKSLMKFNSNIHLDIVGDGPEMEMVKNYIKINNLELNITLYGSVFESNKIKEIFSNSILCISPSQAGLSVLLSLGYGVPFVTKYDAITGGEKNNIINNFNGFLYKTEDELLNIILNSYNNVDELKKIGLQCHDYYKEKCSIENMGKGFIDSINYVINK